MKAFLICNYLNPQLIHAVISAAKINTGNGPFKNLFIIFTLLNVVFINTSIFIYMYQPAKFLNGSFRVLIKILWEFFYELS